MKTITCISGRVWRVDRENSAAHRHVQLNLSPPDHPVRNHRALTIPRGLAQQAMEGRIRVRVS